MAIVEIQGARPLRRLWPCAVALVVLFVVLVFLGRLLFVSGARRALPWSASDVHEHEWVEDGILPQDFDYKLKARMPKEELAAYAARLGLPPYVPGQPTTSGWGADTALGWWDPPARLDGAYASFGDGSWTVLIWSNGWVYFASGCI